MSLKKYGFMLIVMIFTLTLIPVMQVNAETLNPKDVVLEQNFEIEQIDNEVLTDMALEGNLVNNKHTKVQVSKDDEKTVVTIKKLLKQRELRNGTIEEDHLILSTAYLTNVDNNPQSTDSSDQASPLGYIEEDENDHPETSYTVGMTVGIYYSTYTSETGQVAYKITSYLNRPVLKDSDFRLYSVYTFASYSGQGFSATGRPLAYVSDMDDFTVDYPQSGKTNTKSSGFTEYVVVIDGVSGGGVNAKLKYQRIIDSKIYTYGFPVDLPSS
ncbi:MAG: hypothetical protein PHT79_10560 [Syntrophomonadaceae bacterium]|nr:hypothetical protein [Syntrophomonadaceae bacterium]MDD4550185.1 hypothetical protein [Syntrophomonadaceae bacterium]